MLRNYCALIVSLTLCIDTYLIWIHNIAIVVYNGMNYVVDIANEVAAFPLFNWKFDFG